MPADVTYVDLPAPPTSPDGREPAESPPIRSRGCGRRTRLLHVVRAFEDPSVPHPRSVDAWRDLERLDLEFVLADLSVMEKRIEKLQTSGRHGTPAEREQNEREELAVLEKLAPALREGKPIRDLEER